MKLLSLKPIHYSLLVLALLVLGQGCKGISSSGVSETQRFQSGFRSLRIGQITTANNRVATTMAIDNREAIVVIEPAPGSPSLTEVLYQSENSFTTEILIGIDSLPVQANTDDSNIMYSGYTNSTVTLEVQNMGIALPQQTVTLDPDIFGFFDLNKNSIRTKALTEADLRRIFTLAIIAVRVFGCSAQDFIQNTSSTSLAFGSLTDSACTSVLVTTMLNVLKVGDFEDRILEGYIGDPVGCSYEEGDFQSAMSCVTNSKVELVKEALTSNPNIEAILDGTFDPNTGEVIPPTPSPMPTPTPTSTESSPRPTATPEDSVPPLPDAPVPGAPVPA